MKILVLPRDDATPYQALLYAEMHRHGVSIHYLATRTPSHTLNLLLLPLELAVHRLSGARIVHLHWVYAFSLPGAERFPALRRIAQIWFILCLYIMRALGMHLVWTAHNVLPHTRIFADDIIARRQLAAACSLVFAHSQSALDELAEFGAVPRMTAIIPHGPLTSSIPVEDLRTPGAGDGPRQFLFFGKVRDYKGVSDLVAAFATIPSHLTAYLKVAGECGDPDLRSALGTLAQRSGDRVTLRLERVPDAELDRLLAEADAVVLPFRRITTSGSAMLALSYGRPLVLPDLATLAEFPDEAVIRYDGTVQGLVGALARLILADAEVLAKMSAAARAYCSTVSWQGIAETTIDNMHRILASGRHASACDQRAGMS